MDWQIKRQINTQVKLHFERTNSKNKIFPPKSYLTGSAACPANSTCNCGHVFFWNLISSPVENYWFQFGNKVRLLHTTLKAFNAKQRKKIAKRCYSRRENDLGLKIVETRGTRNKLASEKGFSLDFINQIARTLGRSVD